MVTSPKQAQDAIGTLAAVVRLLCRCTDMVFAQPPGPGQWLPAWSALGLGADVLASEAMDLLPAGADIDDPVPVQTDPVQLLLAAQELTRAHPVEAFPPGTSWIIAGIADLVRENPA